MDIARLVQDAARLHADLQLLQRALEPATAPASDTGELPGIGYSGEAAALARRQQNNDAHIARINAIRAQFGIEPLPPPGPEFTHTEAPHDDSMAAHLPPLTIGPK
jgi:hypothetical protein